jgi:paraquat-inducible protein A
MVEFVGRWSMLDVFAVSILVALVQVQSLAVVEVRPGALAFAAVVVLTMLAAQSFDERLLWDAKTGD